MIWIFNLKFLVFHNTLERDITADRETFSKKLFTEVLQSNRPENTDINDTAIVKDARDLYETETKLGVDGSTFIRLLCTHRFVSVGYFKWIECSIFMIKVMHN